MCLTVYSIKMFISSLKVYPSMVTHIWNTSTWEGDARRPIIDARRPIMRQPYFMGNLKPGTILKPPPIFSQDNYVTILKYKRT